MVNSGRTKRILKSAIAAISAIAVMLSLCITAGAETYRTVKLDIPRVSQRPGIGDCAIASMATVEAYCHGLPSGDYNSAAYQAVYSANGYSIYAMWSQIGFSYLGYFDMQTLYNQLKTGYPVIVHRTSSHYSVVYGYVGSTSRLELSGFLIVDVDDSYNNSSSAYKRLDAWKGGYSLDAMVIRLDGLTISSKSLKINGNHPAAYSAKGEKFTPYGRVISNSNITNVTVSVISSAGSTVQNYSAAPNAKSFALSKAAGNINVSSLQTGSYVYSVYAKDASGATKTVKFNFGVGVAPGTSTDTGSTQPAAPTPEIKKVSYKAVVDADPSLNIRKSADVNSQWLATIPDGEIIDITAECSGWGQTSYKGIAGWVCLDYVRKYNEIKPASVVTEPVEVPAAEVRYARAVSAADLKSAKNVSSSTVVSAPKNAILRIKSSESGWFKVLYNGKEGYISSNSCVADVFDIDGNQMINSSDALFALEAAIGRKKLTDNQFKVGDANGDGRVNSTDALVILSVATGEKKF